MSVVERAKRGVSTFHTHTHYYNATLQLRLKISVDGHQLEIDKSAVGEDVFLQFSDLRLDLFSLSKEVEPVLTKYGVHHILQSRHDGQFPLFELLFTSVHTVEKYLQAKEKADAELQQSISSIIASSSTDPSVSPCVEVASHLYLVIPQKGAHETHLMTLGNYKQLVPKFRESFMFQFDAKTFNKCLGVKVSYQDVLSELDGMVDWFILGVYLGVPVGKLKDVEESYRMPSRRRAEMVLLWSKEEEPTWQRLVNSLVGAGERERARNLASKYGLEVPETVQEPPELAKLGIKDEVHELKKQMMEKDLLLVDQTTTIRKQQHSAVEAKRIVERLKKKMATFGREYQEMVASQSERKAVLREKEEELQHLKEAFNELGRRNKELEKMIEKKEMEVAKLREELSSYDMKLKEKAEEASKLRNELLQSSGELELKCKEIRHLEDVTQDLRDTINGMKTSMELQIQQQLLVTSSMKQIQSLLSSEYEAKAKEAEAYQQTVRQKEQEIAKLNSQLQEQEAVIKKQMSSPVPSLSVDRSVMEVVELRDLLGKAEEEREKALRQVKALKKEIAKQVAGELLEADPTKCEAYGPGITTAEINTTATFKVSVVDQQNRPCTRPTQLTTRLQSRVDGSIVETAQTSEDAATYQVQYTATQRGRHQLSVAVNDVEIPGSPFGVFVSIAPTALGTPVHVIEGLNNPAGIATSRDSDVIVCDDHKITVYTMRGEKIRQFGSEGKGKGQFSDPWGVALDSDGCIYVSDTGNERIQKFTFDGQYINSVTDKDLIGCPRGLKINNNKLYVCDEDNNRILIFDRELNYITHIGGSKGSGPGQFSWPHDIAWDSSSMLYVADRGNGRIQVLDEDGRYVREFGQEGSGHGELFGPRYIDVARDLVYVSEYYNHRVSVFDTSGRFVCTVGREGRGPGELVGPCGISVSEDHFVCVCDRYNDRVQIF